MTPMKMLSTKVRQPCFKDGVCSIAQKLHYSSAYTNITVYKILQNYNVFMCQEIIKGY